MRELLLLPALKNKLRKQASVKNVVKGSRWFVFVQSHNDSFNSSSGVPFYLHLVELIQKLRVRTMRLITKFRKAS